MIIGSFGIARPLLDALANLNGMFAQLHLLLRGKPEAKEVHRGCDLRRYGECVTSEMFVEVEISESLTYCWWLDVNFYEHSWKIEATLLKTEDGQQWKIATISEYAGDEVGPLIEKLDIARRAISDSATQFQFSSATDSKA